MNSKNSAFTLIELLVVIVIIGILATIAVSTFSGYFEKARLAKAKTNYSQIKTLFLAQNTATEDNLFTGWYSFDGNNDVNTSSPYIVDNSPAGNNLTTALGSGTFHQSDDTPLGIGKSLYTDKKRLALYGSSNIKALDSNKLTMAVWVKVLNEENGRVVPFFISASAGFYVFPNQGTATFYINKTQDGVSNTKKLIKRNEWHYLVGSYDGDSQVMRLWIDGELVGVKENVPLTTPFQGTGSNHGGIHIGFEYTPTPPLYKGYVDEAMMFPFAFDGKKLQ